MSDTGHLTLPIRLSGYAANLFISVIKPTQGRLPSKNQRRRISHLQSLLLFLFLSPGNVSEQGPRTPASGLNSKSTE
jgi:hypothetical protein